VTSAAGLAARWASAAWWCSTDINAAMLRRGRDRLIMLLRGNV